MQELLKQDTRISPAKEALYPLAGLIYCGDCMESMVRKTVPAGGKKYVYYVCSGNKKDKKCVYRMVFYLNQMKRLIL